MALFHRQIGKGRGIAHKTKDFAINQGRQIQVNAARHVTAEAHILVGLLELDSGPTLAQGLHHAVAGRYPGRKITPIPVMTTRRICIPSFARSHPHW
jgi:hypothetical protein